MTTLLKIAHLTPEQRSKFVDWMLAHKDATHIVEWTDKWLRSCQWPGCNAMPGYSRETTPQCTRCHLYYCTHHFDQVAVDECMNPRCLKSSSPAQVCCPAKLCEHCNATACDECELRDVRCGCASCEF